MALAIAADSMPGAPSSRCEQLGDELPARSGALVDETGRRDTRSDELLRSESRIDGREVQQATNQQRRRHDEHDGEGELDGG